MLNIQRGYLSSLLIASLILLVDCTSKPTSDNATEEREEGTSEEEVLDEGEEIAAPEELETDKTSGELTQETYEEIVGGLGDEYEGYDISISTDVYEASTSIDWKIDEDLQVLYYKESYSIEGTEGSREYFYENGNMACYMESESVGDATETIFYCRGSGGIKITSGFDRDDVTEPFTSGDLDQKQQMIRQSLDEFVDLLKKSEVTTKGETEYTISIEEETEYDGIETTNKTQIVISKELYQKLVGDN